MFKLIQKLGFAAALITVSSAAMAQVAGNSEEKQKADAAQLAQKLTNPVADLMTVPFQFNYNGRIGPRDNGQTAYVNFQPVIPIHITDNWNLIARTVAPLVWQTKVFPGSGTQTGLGNIEQSFFFSPKDPIGGWIMGAGPILYLPTATDKLLGTSQTGAGPTAVFLRMQDGWTYGALINQVWGFMGPVSYGQRPVNQIYMQPFISYTTKSAWTFSLNSESQYDWYTQKWTMPFNFTVSKLVMFDKQPVSFQIGARYYATSPVDGPKGFGARASVTFLFSEK